MYIPLRVFSPFSVGFGAVQLGELADFCEEHRIPAAGIADRDTLGGSMTVSKTLSARGVQPLIGGTFRLAFGGAEGDIVLFATSNDGYRSLLRLANRWNTTLTPSAPDASELADILGAGTCDIIALTAGRSGLLETMIDDGKPAAELAGILKDTFPGALYAEIQRPKGAPSATEADLRAIASDLGLPVVATQETHYTHADMTGAHDAFLCVADKTYLAEAARRHAVSGLHLLTPAEMAERFADVPEALANTVEIARRASFMLEPRTPRLPAFPTANGESEDDALRALSRNGLAGRLSAISPMEMGDDPETYQTRLDYEIDIITKMGFSGYFLIVSDFIGWARSQSIPVGPGRGSGAGSLVAWALGITDIDPLRFGLLFERFLNPERVSMPDFDIDFCQGRREEVIDYVRGKYGAERVAHIAAFGTLQARAVVRDVGRVMQIAYPVVDRFAKMIPNNPANPIRLAEAMEQEALASELAKAGKDVQAMFQTALQLEGLYRNVSTHAAGMIISDRPVAEDVPVHVDKDGKLATSFEMKAVEAAGLVKFDFLGLKNLDIIQGAIDFVAATTGEAIDLDEIGFEDAQTFAQLAGGDGFAVFQLEGSGMRQAMKDLRVGDIEELIALISLYRPGPMDQIATYAAVKNGEQDVHYAHRETREVLEPTNGVMIYQEQVMEIARRLAGYSLGDADLLRRAMGKKIQSEMDAQRKRFCEGASAGWVDIELDDGKTRRVHALTRLPALDGTGRTVTLSEAMSEGIEVAL
jgi:DNA polymerase-3 subunit alpha